MKKVRAIVVVCSCSKILLVPLQNMKIHVIKVEDPTKPEFEMAVTDGGEGAESEDEMSQETSEADGVQSSGTFSLGDPGPRLIH